MSHALAPEIHPTAFASPEARTHASSRGSRIVIGTHSQVYDFVVIHAVGGPRGGVVVEDDVWIGAHCVLLDGTHIESGAVIAAGSVIKGRITGRAIWGGNPCQLLAKRGT